MDNYDIFESTSLMYIREYAYKNGNAIYNFMEKNSIGKSTYGALMDAAAKGKGVIAHRLYGHHLIYDFPINNLNEVAPFLSHLFSDLFTKQGLPILPSKILEDLGLLKCCDKLKGSWNFVNGFDILAGTVSIYQGIDKFKRAFSEEFSVETFEDFANTLGVGALELAISLSTSNPFLLIGSILHLTSGIRGMLNDNSMVYLKNLHYGLSLEFSINKLDVNKRIKIYSAQESIKKFQLEEHIKKLRPLNRF